MHGAAPIDHLISSATSAQLEHGHIDAGAGRKGTHVLLVARLLGGNGLPQLFGLPRLGMQRLCCKCARSRHFCLALRTSPGLSRRKVKREKEAICMATGTALMVAQAGPNLNAI